MAELKLEDFLQLFSIERALGLWSLYKLQFKGEIDTLKHWLDPQEKIDLQALIDTLDKERNAEDKNA